MLEIAPEQLDAARFEGGPEVVMLALQPFDPFPRVAAHRLRLLSEGKEVFCMESADCLRLAAFLEPFECVLADRLEHQETWVAVRADPLAHEAIVDERGQRLEVGDTDLFGRLERAAAEEDTQSREADRTTWRYAFIATARP